MDIILCTNSQKFLVLYLRACSMETHVHQQNPTAQKPAFFFLRGNTHVFFPHKLPCRIEAGASLVCNFNHQKSIQMLGCPGPKSESIPKRCSFFFLCTTVYHCKRSSLLFHRWWLKFCRDNRDYSINFVYCNTVSMKFVYCVNLLLEKIVLTK